MVSTSQKLVRIAAAVLVTVAPLLAPPPASAKVTQENFAARTTFSQDFVNSCTSETVHVEGHVAAVFQTVYNDKFPGTQVVKLVLSFHGTGTGLVTDTDYVFGSHINNTWNVTPGGTIVAGGTEAGSLRFIAQFAPQGNSLDGDHAIIKADIRAVVNPDGTVVVGVANVSLQCL